MKKTLSLVFAAALLSAGLPLAASATAAIDSPQTPIADSGVVAASFASVANDAVVLELASESEVEQSGQEVSFDWGWVLCAISVFACEK